MLRSILVLLSAFAAIAQCELCPGCKRTTDVYDERKKFDYLAVCQVYKTAYDCNSQCPQAQQVLTAGVTDLCLPGTNQLNGCGTELTKCVFDMMQAKNSVSDKKAQCSDIAAFFQCSSTALGKCSSSNTTNAIDTLTATVAQLNMQSGCDGKCAAKVGLCMAGLTADVTTAGGLNPQNFKDMCRQLGSSTRCINPLKQTVCSTSQTNIDLADKEILAMQQRLSDLCDTEGKPTPCALGFMQCGSTLNTITAQNGCKVMSSYLTCAERLPCKYSIEDAIKQQIKTVSAAQQQSGCPTLGGCRDRLQQCVAKAKSSLDKYVSATPTPTLTNFCLLSQTIEQCFIVVRHDPNCKYENLEAGQDEQRFFGMFGSQCGNVTACDQVVSACRSLYANVQPNAPLTTQCASVGDAVACVQMMLKSDVCVRVQGTIQSKDQSMINVFDKDCGNATACDTGVTACYTPVKPIIYDPDTAKAKDCPIIKAATSCMDKMRRSQICKLVQQKLQTGEQAVKAMDSKLCGSAASVQGSVMLLVVALFVTLWK